MARRSVGGRPAISVSPRTGAPATRDSRWGTGAGRRKGPTGGRLPVPAAGSAQGSSRRPGGYPGAVPSPVRSGPWPRVARVCVAALCPAARRRGATACGHPGQTPGHSCAAVAAGRVHPPVARACPGSPVVVAHQGRAVSTRAARWRHARQQSTARPQTARGVNGPGRRKRRCGDSLSSPAYAPVLALLRIFVQHLERYPTLLCRRSHENARLIPVQSSSFLPQAYTWPTTRSDSGAH